MSNKLANSNLNLEKLRARLAAADGRTYWRSLEELADTEEFQDYLRHEFPAGADTWTDPVGRRRFLQLMGASIAFSGVTACVRQPDEKLVPHVKAPEEVIPGRPLFYASAFSHGGYGQGILVESHDGRPTKIEGNPRHPASLGATTVWAQASVLDLYDPDRLTAIESGGRPRSWEHFSAALLSEVERFRNSGGRGLRILTGTVTSPTLGGQLRRLLADLPAARWHQYEALPGDSAREGAVIALGRPLDVHYRLDRADRIVSLDADILFDGPASLRYTKDFTARRKVENGLEKMNRLYVAESSPTLTGTMADHRLAVPAGHIARLARGLGHRLGLEIADPAELSPREAAWLAAVADDLVAHRGRSVVVAGACQPAAVHALALALNEVLGAMGTTVVVTEPVEVDPVHQMNSLSELVEAMQAGEVETLLILGGNPVYTAPADLGFAEALGKVGLRIHLTTHVNETTELCHWRIPESHYLEAWGDIRSFDGTVSVVQPLIEPLYRSRSAIEILGLMLGTEAPPTGYELVRRHWQSQRGGEADFEIWWRRVLHDGLVAGSESAPVQATVNAARVLESLQSLPARSAGIELLLRPDPHVLDGRYANNGWLQEAPKPLTKLTWDNAVLMAPSTAEALGVTSEQMVELRSGDVAVLGPVWIQPAHAPDSVTIHLGYGRSVAGRVASGTGFDAHALQSWRQPWSVAGVTIQPLREKRRLACTQDHYSMEGRHLVREASLEKYREDPEFARKLVPETDPKALLYPGFEYKGHAWGMAVDLSACTGCNACVVACQAENNIAVVGKDQVLNGREMHWIRIDRYYSGGLDEPGTLHQPVMCQHCENAPCETVCPVAATVHSHEGLNDMVYNRCVGTRYCSNNCPYKVRRFNYFLYSDWDTESLKLQRNPDVTVRSRGVMEKCTYCVQRINAAKIQARLEERPLRDGEIQTACQQVCPAEAIVFGDLNDPNSAVAKLKQSARNYGILTEIQTLPRTTYLARITNPNPKLAEEG
jgi:molybdopterin-containing oxidoreductase family iron-sulfur binding subunit